MYLLFIKKNHKLELHSYAYDLSNKHLTKNYFLKSYYLEQIHSI